MNQLDFLKKVLDEDLLLGSSGDEPSKQMVDDYLGKIGHEVMKFLDGDGYCVVNVKNDIEIEVEVEIFPISNLNNLYVKL
jgi:hypothetical protein